MAALRNAADRVAWAPAGSRNDTQELAMQMRISTLYMLDEKKDGKNSAAPGNSKKADGVNVAAKKEGARGSEF